MEIVSLLASSLPADVATALADMVIAAVDVATAAIPEAVDAFYAAVAAVYGCCDRFNCCYVCLQLSCCRHHHLMMLTLELALARSRACYCAFFWGNVAYHTCSSSDGGRWTCCCWSSLGCNRSLRPRLGSAIPMAVSRRLTEVIRPALASSARLSTALLAP